MHCYMRLACKAALWGRVTMPSASFSNNVSLGISTLHEQAHPFHRAGHIPTHKAARTGCLHLVHLPAVSAIPDLRRCVHKVMLHIAIPSNTHQRTMGIPLACNLHQVHNMSTHRTDVPYLIIRPEILVHEAGWAGRQGRGRKTDRI